MLSLVSLANRGLGADALRLTPGIRVSSAELLSLTPQLGRLCAEALHKTLQSRMVEAGLVWKCSDWHFSLAFAVIFQSLSCLTVCNPMRCSTPGSPDLHYLPELAQTHVHQVGDVIQPSHSVLPPSPLALNLPQHQGLFQ